MVRTSLLEQSLSRLSERFFLPKRRFLKIIETVHHCIFRFSSPLGCQHSRPCFSFSSSGKNHDTFFFIFAPFTSKNFFPSFLNVSFAPFQCLSLQPLPAHHHAPLPAVSHSSAIGKQIFPPIISLLCFFILFFSTSLSFPPLRTTLSVLYLHSLTHPTHSEVPLAPPRTPSTLISYFAFSPNIAQLVASPYVLHHFWVAQLYNKLQEPFLSEHLYKLNQFHLSPLFALTFSFFYRSHYLSPILGLSSDIFNALSTSSHSLHTE